MGLELNGLFNIKLISQQPFDFFQSFFKLICHTIMNQRMSAQRVYI